MTNVFSFEQKQIISLNEKQKEKLFAKRPKVTLQFALPDNDTNIFDFKNVEIKQVKPLIEQESLEIYQGKTTLLTGKNGTGKSTLFKVLTKMLPYNGSITYLNKEINKYRTFAYLQHVAQIFQNASDQFLMITVEEEIELSKKHRVNSYFTDDKITQALAELNLSTHLKQVVYTLSGGQKKKLQILLMLISGHEVLLIDEPLSGLDQESTVKVLQLIKESQKEMKQTIILISHQLHDLQNFCDYHLNLANKQLTYTTGVNYES